MIYRVPPPPLPSLVYGLGTLVVFGLVALGVAAYHAFAQVAPPYQALPAAILIEAGMVVEAAALVRRNGYALPGLIVSLLVSGTYNFIQAEQAGKLLAVPITHLWPLATLAVGPLSALLFMALALGHELKQHEGRVAAWTRDRLTWLDAQQRKAETAQQDSHRQEQEAQGRQAQLQAQLELQKEKARLESEERIRVAQIAADERQVKREAALARARIAAQAAQTTVQPAPAVARPAQTGKYEDFRRVQSARNGVGPMAVQEIMVHFGVSRRTAYDWLKKFSVENRAALPAGQGGYPNGYNG